MADSKRSVVPMKKVSGWKTKGMNRDLSVSAFNPEFAFENMNLRLSTNEGNTALSWVNEKGTVQINLMQKGRGANLITLYGVCIGTAVLNEYLVLFITERGYADAPDGIYRLESAGEYTMDVTALYEGNLKFDREHPIETLVSYEAKDIQKVYWTDGINQPRLINISPDNDKNRSRYTDTSFDFIPTLQLNETIKVKKVHGGGGMFAPGVIQYAFTYYNKHGQESNIFYVTPLLYISHIDRGASPEDKVDNIFKISITGIDTNFDYLRIYSIQRTSINSTPICKRVQDITVEGEVIETGNASFTDNGTMGNSIDPTELLFKGGNKVWIGTMEQKDNTLFMGDLTTPEINDLSGFEDEKHNTLKESIAVSLRSAKRIFYSLQTSTGDYEYANQLNSYDSRATEVSVPCAGFKYGNKYRCGIQFQDETGKWSTPVWLDDLDVLNETADPEDGDIRPSVGTASRGDSGKDTPTVPDIEPSGGGSGEDSGSGSSSGDSGGGSTPSGGGDSGGDPVVGPDADSTLGSNQIKVIIRNDTSKTAIFTGYLRLSISGTNVGDFCFRNSRLYPTDGSNAGFKVYYDWDKDGDSELVNGYKFGANTESLSPGKSMQMTYTTLLENSSSKLPYNKNGNISKYFGKSFLQSAGKTSGNIKLSIAIDRSREDSSKPNRVDEFPNYYCLRFTDENGNPLSGNPKIKSKGVYYLSIYDARPLNQYSNSSTWSIVPYSGIKSGDAVSTSAVTVSYL